MSAFAADDSGRVFVADQAGIRFYSSASGEYLGRLAGTGQGPGEVLPSVQGMDVAPDGRVVVLDRGNRRINVYDELSHTQTWRLPPGDLGYNRVGIVAGENGSTWVAYDPPLPLDDSPRSFPRPAFLELDAHGRAVDTVWIGTEWTERCPFRSSYWWRAGWYDDLRAPYFPKIQWAMGRDGSVVTGCPASYTFELHRPGGEIVRVTRIDWEPVPVDRAERDGFVAAHEYDRGERGGFRGDGWSWRGPAPPEQRPAYLRLFLDPAGRVWVWPSQRRQARERVARSGPSRVWRPPAEGAFEVFDRSGKLLGAIRWPEELRYDPYPGYSDPYIRGDTVWAVQRDSLDVEYLTKYVIQWNPE
ncbi:MAG: hypothetical protein RQ745_12110 [Longimicrobiales bacterium]|nr:hypothetical protein [Longimicrobiales bacterium]